MVVAGVFAAAEIEAIAEVADPRVVARHHKDGLDAVRRHSGVASVVDTQVVLCVV